MKFKETKLTDVGIASDGKIYIEQFDADCEGPTYVFLSLDQFNKIEGWVFKNRDEIELAWNGGVENDNES